MTVHGLVPMFAATLLLAVSAPAQFPATETAELTPALGELSGASVALHGDVAFVGAPSDQFAGSPRYVHAYRLIGGQWTLEQTLLPDALDDGRFGCALDFDGTTLVVGSPPLPSGGHGRATAYKHDGASWVGTPLVYPPSNEPQMSFGTCVAVDGNSILVGAPLADVPVTGASGEDVGAAWSYRRAPDGTWKLKQQLVPSSPVHQLAFGIALDVSGDEAIVGTAADRAHAFHFAIGTQWSQVQVLTPSLATPASAFGQAVSVSGDRAVIGARFDHTFANGGAAFVFELSCGQWGELQRLAAPAGAVIFGDSVGVSGPVVLVGDSGVNVAGNFSAGTTYAWRWNGVTFGLEQSLHASTPIENGQMGRRVAVHGDRALIGVPGAASTVGGSAFVFDAVPVTNPWTNLGSALAGTDVPELRGTGTLQPSSALTLTLQCGPAGAAGVIFIGLTEIAAPFKGGVLVVQPLIAVGLGLDGNGSLALPATWPSGIPPGTGISLQAWFVDVAGPAGVSASNGLRATAIP